LCCHHRPHHYLNSQDQERIEMTCVHFIAASLPCAVPKDGEWHRTFALTPVVVDAYSQEELKTFGGFTRTVWFSPVEARLHRFTNDDGDVIEKWRYRIVRENDVP